MIARIIVCMQYSTLSYSTLVWLESSLGECSLESRILLPLLDIESKLTQLKLVLPPSKAWSKQVLPGGKQTDVQHVIMSVRAQLHKVKGLCRCIHGM